MTIKLKHSRWRPRLTTAYQKVADVLDLDEIWLNALAKRVAVAWTEDVDYRDTVLEISKQAQRFKILNSNTHQ
jgi:hypothetical protein